MPRALLLVLCSAVVLGQVPRREPFDIALQSYREAQAGGNFEAASDRREEARSILAQTQISSPQWVSRVQAMAQAYQGAGRRVQARAIVEDALSRAESMGGSHSIRIQLLNMLADFWQQNGNLLKALSYREKAVTVQESAPPGDSIQTSRSPYPVSIRATAVFAVNGGRVLSRNANNTYLYQQLADLYRQLGRPERAAKVLEKMRSLIQDDPSELAGFYSRQGQVDEAVALYRKLSEQAAANPQAQIWEIVSPLQSIVGLYQGEQRFQDAVATLQQAVALVESSGRPEAGNQAVGMRLNLANMLQQGGESRAAEQIYEGLINATGSDRNPQHVQVIQAYAHQLSQTKRTVEGEALLKNYLNNHVLQPHEEANILFSLSQIARNAGRKEVAEEYQRAATEKQRNPQSQRSEEGSLIGPDLQKALVAVNQGNLNEAIDLALRIMASASLSRDREQITWQVPSIAFALAKMKRPDEGERLFRQLLALLETWAVDNTGPLSQALQQYSRFLIEQKRWAEVPATIDRYREHLMTTQGAESHEMEQVINFRIDLARARAAQAEAVQGADELLAFEESLSGPTSEPYLRAAQIAVGVYAGTGNLERAFSLHRQMIAIADTTLSNRDLQRGFVRINAAMALASARRFEEAELLANEAVAIGERMRPPQTNAFASQAEHIRRMKRAAESGSAPIEGVPQGALVVGDRWFGRRQ